MPKEAPATGSVDPLSGLSGLSLFPRTIRASADAPVPAAPKDLDSIHNIMKSLKEVRSPEKLMSEAKKIVDGGANIQSNFSSFAENVSVTNDFAAKAKDKPQERRPGLGIARKKASFSLKTSISHPSVNLEPALDIDQLQDPDSFFDAYEKAENAKKEIQKQLGVNKENIDLYKAPNNERRRRRGILGKSYNSKHRYSSTASENDDMWMSSQETVYQDIPSPPKDDSQENLTIPDPKIDADLEEVELAESTKTESQVNDMLEELLSCNYEDLEEQGALNLLQERLNIKTLDMDNLRCLTDRPDVGRTNILNSPGSRKKSRKSSAVLDSALKVLNKKPRMEQELVENPVNPVSSPTPPRNPFGSISLLKRKILKPNPLTDPYSPQDIDLCAHPNLSSAQTKDKLHEHDATPKNLSMGNEMESHVEFGYTEPALADIDAHEVMEKAKTPEQSGSENGSRQRESGSSRADVSPPHPKDKPVGQVATPKDLGMCNDFESHVELGHETSLSDMDSQEVIGKAGKTPEQSRSENLSMQRESGSSRANDSPAPEQSGSENGSRQRESGSSRADVSPPHPKDKPVGQVATPKDLGMCNEFESHVELCHETSLSDMDSQEVIGKAGKTPDQSRSENLSMQRESGSSRANDSPAQPRDKLIGHADAPKDLGMFNEMESTVELDSTTSPFCNLNTGETIGNADGVPEQFEDENARIPSMDTSTQRNEESDNIGDTMNTNRNESSPSVVDDEARDDTSTRRQINPQLQPKVQAVKRQSRKRVAGERIRAAHPMRKSLAEAGTSLEAGVRRSKRVKMRPLEYWKGERFLYGRVEDSLKLIGVKYFSPGKSNENLKVKPYIMAEKPEYKELLDLAARH